MAKLERRQTEYDQQTGEILSDVSNVISIKRLPEEPPYIKMYIEDLGRIMGLTRASERDILLYVAACVAYDGVVSLTARRRAQIAITTGLNEKTIRNAITEFCKLEILRRVGRGEYELNPHLFARGDWATIRERREAFSFTTVYDAKNGRMVAITQKLADDERTRAVLESKGQQRLCD